jgi:hypothetical protein
VTDYGDVTIVAGLLIPPVESAVPTRRPAVPYVKIRPPSTASAQALLAAESRLAYITRIGLAHPATRPFEVLHAPAHGWCAAIGPTKANIYTPGGVSLAYPIDTTQPGWTDAIRGLDDRLVVFYLSVPETGAEPALDLVTCARARQLAGGVVRCEWRAVDPPPGGLQNRSAPGAERC